MDDGAGQVEVHLFAAARAAAGTDLVKVAPGTVAAVLAAAVARHPGLAEVLPRCSFLLDEVATKQDTTVVSAGSRLDVLPPFAGG